MTPFKIETMYSEPYKKKGQTFGNPKIKKHGKEIDVRTWINENNIDCEIYETLEKYGTVRSRKANAIEIKGDLEKLDLREALDRKIATEQLWTSLPLETRKEFNHNPDEFIKNGIEWANKKIQEEIDKNKPDPETTQTTQTTNNKGE